MLPVGQTSWEASAGFIPTLQTRTLRPTQGKTCPQPEPRLQAPGQEMMCQQAPPPVQPASLFISSQPIAGLDPPLVLPGPKSLSLEPTTPHETTLSMSSWAQLTVPLLGTYPVLWRQLSLGQRMRQVSLWGQNGVTLLGLTKPQLETAAWPTTPCPG